MSLISYLKDSEKIDLTGKDIHEITNGVCLPMRYSDLEQVDNIDDLFKNHIAIMLLYQTETENLGHWVAVIKHPNNLIEVFDPYGLKIDEELKYSKFNLRRHQGEIVPHLTHLLNKTNYKIIYNDVRLQKFLKDVNTCGRWCAWRTKVNDISLKDFQNLFTKNKFGDPDLWISALTINYSI